MLNTLICCVTLCFTAPTQEPSPLQCPVAPDPVVSGGKLIDYAGIRFAFCCDGCVPAFTKEPDKFVKQAVKDKRTVGASLFDPVSGLRIDAKKAKGGFADSNGIRFFFATEANRAQFEASPLTFSKLPEKEALYCPVMKHGIKAYSAAGAYADYGNVRYYMCCPDCLAAFKADPAKHAKSAEKVIATPKATQAPREIIGA